MNRGSLRDAKVPVEVILGSRLCTVEELAGLGEGTIIELDTLAGEPVVLHAAGRMIGRGEVVVIDENFGIRVTELISDDE